jgi:ElaB/YqjD/DUF883 family membrane-anchored ribosome-binding protein
MEGYTNQEDSSGNGPASAISDTLSSAKEKVNDMGRRSADKINESRESAAGALDRTASSLHSGADSVAGMAHSTADSIQTAADYVRRTDVRGMMNDLGEVVKRYPGQALAAAAIVGFLVARGLGARD